MYTYELNKAINPNNILKSNITTKTTNKNPLNYYKERRQVSLGIKKRMKTSTQTSPSNRKATYALSSENEDYPTDGTSCNTNRIYKKKVSQTEAQELYPNYETQMNSTQPSNLYNKPLNKLLKNNNTNDLIKEKEEIISNLQLNLKEAQNIINQLKAENEEIKKENILLKEKVKDLHKTLSDTSINNFFLFPLLFNFFY